MIEKRTIHVTGMSCAACAVNVESMLGALSGVEQATVSYAAGSVYIVYNTEMIEVQKMKEALLSIGYDLLIDGDTHSQLEEYHQKNLKRSKSKLLVAIIFTLPVFVISMFFDHHNRILQFCSLILSLPVMLFSARDFFVSAVSKIRHGMMNMDTLVALSTGIAWIYSAVNTLFPHLLHNYGLQAYVYFESAVVIISFILTGRYFEEKAKTKASSAIRKLTGLQPKELKVLREGKEINIPSEFVQMNDLVLVKPGEYIPVDGKVINGSSFVDESSLSGEAIPQLRKKGDPVYSGTLNQNSILEIVAEKSGKETVLQKVIAMVQQAQTEKPPIQQLADKVSSIFVPAVLIIALFTFAGWYFFSGNPALSFVTTISVLIIACPCALGLATPAAIIAGIGRAARQGIYIKNAEILEKAAKTNVIVFDKTGTITEGKIKAEIFYWLDDRDEYRNIFFAMEQNIHHPLAEAIAGALKNNISMEANLQNIGYEPGKGITVSINSKRYFAGNEKLLLESGIKVSDDIKHKVSDLTNSGYTIVYFGNDLQLLCIVGLSDQLRNNIRDVVKQLESNGMEVWMLTGDIYENASLTAEKAGISNFRHAMLPVDKAEAVTAFQNKGNMVLMAGDGINDAAALSLADVSIAMPQGSDIAIESASATLMKPDLSHIPFLIRLSKASSAIIKQNLFWAFGYNVIAIPLAAGLLYSFSGILLNPMIASAAMALSSLSVVTNSLRLTRLK